MMSSPLTRVPGGTSPSASSLSYTPCRMPWVVEGSGHSMVSLLMLPCFFSSSCRGGWWECKCKEGWQGVGEFGVGMLAP